MAFDLSRIFLRRVSAFSIDISDTAIRGIVLKHGKAGKTKLKHIAEIQLPPGVVVHGAVKEHKQFVKFVKMLKRKLKAHTQFAIVSVSDHLAFVTTQSIPNVDEQKTRTYLQLNAPESLPYPTTEAFFGYETLNTNVAQNLKDIVIGSIRSEDYRGIEQDLSSAGITVLALETRGFSLARLLTKQNITGNFFVINMEAEDSFIYAIDGGHIVFVSSIANQNEDYTNLTSEIARVARYKGIGAKKVYYVSQNSLPNFEQEIAKNSGFEALELKSQLKIAEKLSKKYDLNPFLPAFGAGIRGANNISDDMELTLSPYSVSGFLYSHRYSVSITGLSRLVVVSIVSMITSFTLIYTTLALIQQSFSDRLGTVVINAKDAELVKQANDINAILGNAEQVLKKEINWPLVVNSFQNSTVDGVRVTSFQVNGETGNASIGGFSDTRDNLLKFQTQLNKVPFFKQVTIPPESLSKATNINFVITLTVDIEQVRLVK